MSPRVYQRRFDYDEAAALREQGWTLQAIADRFDVTSTAVRYALDPRRRARQTETARVWRQRRCVECGGPAARHYHAGHDPDRPRCKDCSDRALATSVRERELRCSNCREWKPDKDFPRNRSAKKLWRGRHKVCRVCATVLRREYRERHKVPCEQCGEPCSPANSSERRGSRALCHPCAVGRRAA